MPTSAAKSSRFPPFRLIHLGSCRLCVTRVESLLDTVPSEWTLRVPVDAGVVGLVEGRDVGCSCGCWGPIVWTGCCRWYCDWVGGCVCWVGGNGFTTSQKAPPARLVITALGCLARVTWLLYVLDSTECWYVAFMLLSVGGVRRPLKWVSCGLSRPRVGVWWGRKGYDAQ